MSRDGFKFHFTLRVRWGECDAQGIVFNAEYLNYVEVVHAEYYRNLGIRLYDEKSREYFDVATVKVTLEYKAPARLDDNLDIYLRVSRIGNKSITIETEMYRQDSDELLANGEVIYVDYDSVRGAARVVPDDVKELIGHFEETGEVLPIEGFPRLKRQ